MTMANKRSNRSKPVTPEWTPRDPTYGVVSDAIDRLDRVAQMIKAASLAVVLAAPNLAIPTIAMRSGAYSS
jgi:hypothetical protein